MQKRAVIRPLKNVIRRVLFPPRTPNSVGNRRRKGICRAGGEPD